MQPEGSVALITGGGRGLGAAICRRLARDGMTVIVADLRPDLAESTSESLRNSGATTQCLQLDVSDETQTQRAVDDIVASLGRLDVLVNNAGTDHTLPIDELTVAQWDQVMSVNLRGPFLMSKAVFPAMRRQGGGSIVNIVSTAGKRAWPNASAYHASKWGLLGFSHALHTEGRSCGIKVTAVISGGMRTPFILDRFPDTD
ncbi:MAG TPA: SDR family oxidoreductase, partial [Dehalococcoidia bacterium]|nr:SDR family oxidoreductase [Dehalococcoidia bacterium]